MRRGSPGRECCAHDATWLNAHGRRVQKYDLNCISARTSDQNIGHIEAPTWRIGRLSESAW